MDKKKERNEKEKIAIQFYNTQVYAGFCFCCVLEDTLSFCEDG